jgi:DNA-binding PadR family transcriptional regulator
MLDDGWIEETDTPAGAGPSERRRYYRLTKDGHKKLKAEATRLEEWVRLAQKEEDPA